ncbi:MAG: hypothetical protein CVV60_02940 [Tenericutes bacterium HGW-Tenericutes-5]|jgi:hypothetical protein|nr:MAG: hypothetical protein CVV60_02940 [Tenericutes bacterium HGW-Tenericutes-5]
MKNGRLMRLVLIVFVMMLFSVSITVTYGYWTSDILQGSYVKQNQIMIGQWETLSEEEQSIQDLEAFAEWIESNGGPIGMVYDNFTVTNGTQISFENILLEGIEWDILGTGTTDRNNKRPTIGFVQVIDRTLNSSNQPLHQILPAAPTDPIPYPEYSFFLANDVLNTNTNNLNSIRLNYKVEITTSTMIENVSSVSFYAYRGLYDSVNEGTTYNPLVNRDFTVSVSTDGISWTTIGSGTPGSTTNSSASFNYYSFNIPSNLQNVGIYIKIYFNGGSVFSSGNHYYSRLVIDELQINN